MSRKKNTLIVEPVADKVEENVTLKTIDEQETGTGQSKKAE